MHAVKRLLAEAIVRRLQGWEQHAAATLAGIGQPRISDLRRGRLERLSVERMIRCLIRLGEDVEIHLLGFAPTVRPMRRGKVTVRDNAQP